MKVNYGRRGCEVRQHVYKLKPGHLDDPAVYSHVNDACGEPEGKNKEGKRGMNQ